MTGEGGEDVYSAADEVDISDDAAEYPLPALAEVARRARRVPRVLAPPPSRV